MARSIGSSDGATRCIQCGALIRKAERYRVRDNQRELLCSLACKWSLEVVRPSVVVDRVNDQVEQTEQKVERKPYP